MRQKKIGKKNRPICTTCGSRDIKYSPEPWRCNKCGQEGGIELFCKSKEVKR